MTGSMSGWGAATTGESYVQDTERRLNELGRRTRLPNAKQILGPGIAPWAVQVFDWNDERTLYNGIWYSEVGALNTPDDDFRWIGTTYATQDGRGVQIVRSMGVSVTGVDEYVRRFWTAAGATPTYGPWEAQGSTLPMGVALSFGGAWGPSVPGPTTGTAFPCGAGVLRGVASASGYWSASTGIQVDLYVDGVNEGMMRLAPAHSINVHLTLPSVAFEIEVDAGVHFVYFHQAAGSSDSGDRGSFFGTVTAT